MKNDNKVKVIEWKDEDIERYNTEGPREGDMNDYAAYIAYVISEAGHKLYRFEAVDDSRGWLIDVGEGLKWYEYVGGRLYARDDIDALRAENNALRDEVAKLTRENEGLRATAKGYRLALSQNVKFAKLNKFIMVEWMSEVPGNE